MTTVAAFDYAAPHSLSEASALLVEHGPQAAILAGGTDLLVRVKQELRTPDVVVDLQGLPELTAITASTKGLTLGSMTTPDQLARHPLIQRWFPAVAQAARLVGGVQIRTMATLGGSLATGLRCQYRDQSPLWRQSIGPCAGTGGKGCPATQDTSHPTGSTGCVATVCCDLPPALLAHHGEALVWGPAGPRRIDLAGFRRSGDDPSLRWGDIITALSLPWPGPTPPLGTYEKVRLRRGIDRPLVGLAVTAGLGDDGQLEKLAIATCGNGPEVRVLPEAHLFNGASLDDDVIEALVRALRRWYRPSLALRVDPKWRRLVAGNLLRRALTQLAAQPRSLGNQRRQQEAPWQTTSSPIR